MVREQCTEGEELFCTTCGSDVKDAEEKEWHTDLTHNIVLKKDVIFEEEDKKKKSSKPKREIHKTKGKIQGKFVESIIIDEEPRFLCYDLKTSKLSIEKQFETEENIIKPLDVNQYGYIPYEFTKPEIDQALKNKVSKNILFDEIKKQIDRYLVLREIDKHLVLGDAFLTYEQEHISTLHFLYVVGETESGKSTILHLFRWLGYRCLYGEDIPNADIYNFLGTDEEGAGVIAEDEAQGLFKHSEKIRTYKNSYSKGSKKPRIIQTQNSKKQVFYFTFCFKIFAGEVIPEDKGFKERLAVIHMLEGQPKSNIKRLNKEEKKELLTLRKALLIYKLQNTNNELPKVETGLIQRDQELWADFLGVVNDTKYFEKCKETVAYYVNQRHESIWNSIEARILKLVKQKLDSNLNLSLEVFWNHLINIQDELPGRLDKETFYPYDFGIKVTRHYLSSLFEAKYQAVRITTYKTDEKGKKHKITVYRFGSDVLEVLSKKYNIKDLKTSQPVLIGGNGQQGQLTPNKADQVDQVDHLKNTDPNQMFYCWTCDAGWFNIKEESKSSGSILSFHQKLDHDIEFREKNNVNH